MLVFAFGLPGYLTLKLYDNPQITVFVAEIKRWISYWMLLAVGVWMEGWLMEIPGFYYFEVR